MNLIMQRIVMLFVSGMLPGTSRESNDTFLDSNPKGEPLPVEVKSRRAIRTGN
jgi:hypothetical protein